MSVAANPTMTLVPDQAHRVLSVKAFHLAERLRLKDVRDRIQYQAKEFSNYEMIVPLTAPESYLFLYSFGSVVFFNATDEDVERELARLREFRTASESVRPSDTFLVEISDTLQNKVFFDRVHLRVLSFEITKIVSIILGQSTALEYYEIVTENLLEQTQKFSRKLEKEGRFLEESVDLIKFIGQCLNTKQEIISRLHILDAPDEVWENNELERIFVDLKAMLEISARYKALEYKIQIIQESVEIIVDLSKSHRATQLEIVIIVLISFEILISIFFHFFIK